MAENTKTYYKTIVLSRNEKEIVGFLIIDKKYQSDFGPADYTIS